MIGDELVIGKTRVEQSRIRVCSAAAETGGMRVKYRDGSTTHVKSSGTLFMIAQNRFASFCFQKRSSQQALYTAYRMGVGDALLDKFRTPGSAMFHANRT